MPVHSKKQWKFMQALAHGAKMKDKPEGLNPKKAKEFIHATPSYKDLPESKPKFKKLRKHMSGEK